MARSVRTGHLLGQEKGTQLVSETSCVPFSCLAQSFQAGAPSGPGRMFPDVSADADPATGYSIVVHGQPTPVGGTSAATPLYAGLFASFGTKLGFVTPKLWANQVCFNDITQGDNGYYRAGPGPDPCSGIGSPIAAKLATLLTGSPHSIRSPWFHQVGAARSYIRINTGPVWAPEFIQFHARRPTRSVRIFYSEF